MNADIANRERIAREVNAVRTSVGYADLSNRGKLRITGRERATWLHNIVSNMVEKLAVGDGNYGTFLTDRGKMVGDFRLLVRDDCLLLDTEPELADSLPAAMDRFLISEDAEIHRDHDRWTLLGLMGPQSAEWVSRALVIDVPGLALYGSIEAERDGTRVVVSRQNRAGETGYDLWLDPSLAAKVRDMLSTAGVTEIGSDALEVLRIEAGIARYGADTHDDIIPLEARLDHAIHYEKGCYIGQEIIARMHYRGHPNKLLICLRFDGGVVPEPLTDIYPEPGAEKRNGWVTSTTYSPTLDAVIGLGYVRAQQAITGARFVVKVGDDWVGVELSEKPFIVGG